MKKTLSWLVVLALFMPILTPALVFANDSQVETSPVLLESTNASIEDLTSNEWLRQIVELPEGTANSENASAIIEELEKYNDNVLKGLALNNAKIKLVETIEGLAELPDGTDGTLLDAFLTSDRTLYLKLQPSNNHSSSYFVLQQAALLINKVLFNNIFASKEYESYYNYDKNLVIYKDMAQVEFFAESLAYLAAGNYTEVYKTIYTSYYLYYLYHDYIPAVDRNYYINKIVEYPKGEYNIVQAATIVSEFEKFNTVTLQGLELNAAKLKLIQGSSIQFLGPNILEIGIDRSFEENEILTELVNWIDASLWYNRSASLDFKYIYDYSYEARIFALDRDLTQDEYFNLALVLHLNGQSIRGGTDNKLETLYYFIRNLYTNYKPVVVNYNDHFDNDPIQFDTVTDARLEDLLSKIIKFSAGDKSYDEEEVERIKNRIKKYGPEILQGMVYNELEIRLTSGPITDEPEMAYLADVTPRGWPEGSTWAQVPGSGGNPTFVRIGHSYYGLGHSTINLELHESAHLVDYNLFGSINSTEEWKALHEAESVNLFGNDGYMSVYPEEYFAETMAYYFLSGHTRQMLKEKAPQTYEYLHTFFTNFKAVNPFNAEEDKVKSKLIDKLLVSKKKENKDLKNKVIIALKRLNVELLKALVGNGVTYQLDTLGNSGDVTAITSVNPILNQVARDIDTHAFDEASQQEGFLSVFNLEAPVVNEPKVPKSLFYDQPTIAENADEYFAEVTAMYFNHGTTRYALSDLVPETLEYLTELFTSYKYVNNNANLKDLKLSDGKWNQKFTANTTSYTINVNNKAKNISVTPIVSNSKATVTINGESVMSGKKSKKIDLKVGETNIKVIVTAENGNTKTYTLKIVREDEHAKNNNKAKLKP